MCLLPTVFQLDLVFPFYLQAPGSALSHRLIWRHAAFSTSIPVKKRSMLTSSHLLCRMGQMRWFNVLKIVWFSSFWNVTEAYSEMLWLQVLILWFSWLLERETLGPSSINTPINVNQCKKKKTMVNNICMVSTKPLLKHIIKTWCLSTFEQ